MVLNLDNGSELGPTTGPTISNHQDWCANSKGDETAPNPKDIGVEIRKIGKTKDENVLIEMANGEDQAQKLEDALKCSLGESVEI